MTIKVDKNTLRKRAQSKLLSTNYVPTAKNLADAVRNTPGVRKNVTPIKILNLPSDVMAMVDPNGKVYRSIASVPNLRHVPKFVPKRGGGSNKKTRNQTARRIQRGARNTINKGLANRVDNALFFSRNKMYTNRMKGRASPLMFPTLAEYVRANPAPTNRNIGAAVTIAASILPPRFGKIGSPQSKDKFARRLKKERQHLENLIAAQIETYRPEFPAARSPQRSNRRTSRSNGFKSSNAASSRSNGSAMDINNVLFD